MWKFILIILYLTSKSLGGNILIAYDIASPSHQIWNYAIASALAQKGHNVTMLGTAVKEKEATTNYHPISLEGVYEAIHIDFDITSIVNMSPLGFLEVLFDYTYTVCDLSLKTNGFQQLLNYPPDFKFDLIIIDVTMGSCLYPFIQKFNYPPTIGITAFLLPPFVSNNFGNILQPSYIPWHQLPYSLNMTFPQRVTNFFFTYAEIFLKSVYETPKIEDLQKKAFGKNVRSTEELEPYLSLVLCNINPIFSYPQPLPPNIIPVGGLHTRPSKDLPLEFQKIVNNSKKGVILFSLGTNVRSDKLDKTVLQSLLTAFAKLPYIILWKFESELPNLPPNVIIKKWLPINDLLGHSNVKLFISHGGALSTQEAMYHGVPVLGIPFFADQHLNIKSIVDRKLGDSINVHEITSTIVLEKITNILNNPNIYKKNIADISKRYRDLPESSLDKAVFWIEYAIKHNGAYFLNPKSKELPFLVKNSIDVVAFLIFVIFSVLTLIIFGVRYLLRNVFSGKQKKE